MVRGTWVGSAGGVEYHRALMSPRRRVGRGALAIVLVLVGLFGIGGAVTALGAQLDLALGIRNPTLGGSEYTAIYHASNTLGIALLIPWTMFVQRMLYGVGWRSLLSVRSAIRFDIFGRWLLILGPVTVVTMAILSLTIPLKPTNWDPAQLIGVVTITLLLTPLQAAAEEVAFRGFVFRVAAGWLRGPRASLIIGIMVSTGAFVLIHPPTSIFLAINQIGLGVGAALIAWRTGGLEIPIILHVLNNVLSQLYAQALHANLLEAAVEPSIVLTLAPTVVATIAVLLRTRGTPVPTFDPSKRNKR